MRSKVIQWELYIKHICKYYMYMYVIERKGTHTVEFIQFNISYFFTFKSSVFDSPVYLLLYNSLFGKFKDFTRIWMVKPKEKIDYDSKQTHNWYKINLISGIRFSSIDLGWVDLQHVYVYCLYRKLTRYIIIK